MGIVFIVVAGIYGFVIGITALVLRLFPALLPAHEPALVELEEIVPDLFDYAKNSGGSSY